MYFGLSEEQEFFQDNVKKFLTDNASIEEIRKIANGEGDDIQKEIYQGIVNLGINALLVPEEFGGLGVGLLHAVAISQALGNGVGPIPFSGSYVMAPIALNLAGNDNQKLNYLSKIATNEIRFGIGLSEFVGAREDAGMEVLNNKASGRALFVVDAENSDYIILSNKAGLMFVIKSSDTGVTLNKLTTVDKTRNFHEVILKEVDCEILEKSEKDIELAKKVVDAGRIILAADTLGASESMIEKAVAYSKERKQFNRTIGSFQAVKHMCAEMAADLEPCYAMVWQAAHSFDTGSIEESRLHACLAKSHLSEVGKDISKKATEVHGGMGFTDLLGLHYWFKRIGLNRQLLGAPELVREEAAEIQGFNQ
jgi:alkylation response protein AidB-like acyl-CoA dehydrogenase